MPRQTDADVDEQIVALARIGVEHVLQRRRIAGRRRLRLRFGKLELLSGQTERAGHDLEWHAKVDGDDPGLDEHGPGRSSLGLRCPVQRGRRRCEETTVRRLFRRELGRIRLHGSVDEPSDAGALDTDQRAATSQLGHRRCARTPKPVISTRTASSGTRSSSAWCATPLGEGADGSGRWRTGIR